jgi:pilus assembly protein Flp/PilA
MKNLLQTVSNFIREEEGLTIVEYAIAGAIISVAVVTAFTTLGDNVQGAVDNLGTDVSTATR